MSLIKIENLSFTYPSSYDPIFENVSFQIDSDWKLGFVGRNGRGKTTFLNLLLGKYEYRGKISCSVQFDYFPYPVRDPELLTEEVLTEICPDAQQWQIVRELSYLEVNDDVLYRPFNTLSNGEQTKVLIAALFLNEGHFLLIDEPTNHLDNNGRKILANYLKKKKGFILVSHDRYFLDTCVDHILSLNRATIEVQNGNFSSWMTNFERQQAFEESQNERLKKDISHLKQAARRTSDWSDKVEATKIGMGPCDRGAVGHKAAKMMKRSKAIEERRERAIEEKSKLLKNAETADDLKLITADYHSDVLLSLSKFSVCYDGRDIFEPISFTVKKGDRIVIDGKNGSGKSSILKLLTGTDIEHIGNINIGSGLIISYVPQDTSHLHGTLSDYARENGVDESLFKAMLRKLDFERVQFEKDIKDFSGGQKKKVLIAKSICDRAHIYIWDEPLNFIDIYSRIQIEQLIEEFNPTMIFVEHDQMFRNKTATQRIELK